MSGIPTNRTNITLPPEISQEILAKTQERSAVMTLSRQIALPGRGAAVQLKQQLMRTFVCKRESTHPFELLLILQPIKTFVQEDIVSMKLYRLCFSILLELIHRILICRQPADSAVIGQMSPAHIQPEI